MVILYDPVQTANGELTIKAYRLSKAFMHVYREKKNEVIKPSEILEELPIKIRNPGIINALIFDLQASGAGWKASNRQQMLMIDRTRSMLISCAFCCGFVKSSHNNALCDCRSRPSRDAIRFGARDRHVMQLFLLEFFACLARYEQTVRRCLEYQP